MNARALFYLVHGRKPGRVRRTRSGYLGPARDWRYRAWIRTLPSIVSGKFGCDACHTVNNGLGSKGTCYSCVPLTREEHIEYDANRKTFEAKHGISMVQIVRNFNQDWELGRREAA